MGGFEGGDEAGFWEIDTQILASAQSSQAYALQYESDANGSYHVKAYALKLLSDEISSDNSVHIAQEKDTFDIISFVAQHTEHFLVEDQYANVLDNSILHSVYRRLDAAVNDIDVIEFFESHKVVLTCKRDDEDISTLKASHVANFMLLLKEVCNLPISIKELAAIALEFDPYGAFFIYNYPKAKLSANGEIVTLIE